MTGFRQIEKEYVPGQAPVVLIDRVRRLAADQRRSLSAVVTEILCRGLGEDPAAYGVDPARNRAG